MIRPAAVFAALWTALAVLWPAAALGHGPGELPAGRAPLLDSSGALVGAVANHGLLRAGGARSAWTPDEGLTDRGLVDGFVAADGAIVVGTNEGTARTEDYGCTWTRDPDPHRVLALVPIGGQTAYRVSERAAGPSGFERTDDGGRTWQPTARFSGERLGRALVAHDGALYGLVQDLTTGDSAVERSDDGGASFTPVHAPSVAWRGFAVTRDHLFGVTDSLQNPELVQVDLRTQETLRVALPERALDLIAVDGAPWIALASGEVRVGLDLTPSDLRAHGLLVRGGAAWARHDVTDGPAHLSRYSGGAWAPALPFRAVEPAACPSGTPGAEAGPAVWDRLQRTGVGDAPSATTPEDELGCRGGAAGGPVVALLAVVFAFGPRRRREP